MTLTRIATTTLLSAAVVIAGLSVTPARADEDGEGLGNLLGGIAAAAIIADAITGHPRRHDDRVYVERRRPRVVYVEPRRPRYVYVEPEDPDYVYVRHHDDWSDDGE